MGIETKPGSKWWYARWTRDGKRHFARLKVEAVGLPGEPAYEAARKKALDAFQKTVASEQARKRPEDFVQEIHRVKFGRRIGSIPLTHLSEAWQNIPRKRNPKEPYLQWAARTLQRLQEFIKAEFPRVKELAAIDKTVAEAFMRSEEKRGVSPKTYNAELILIRGAFERLREDAGMLTNPFAKIVTKDRETIHRKPFSADELKAILEAVKEDDLLRPLVVVGVCTAMRRGDACLLKWESVDMKNGYIRVKTSKTGETVEIPMLPLLREELKKRPEGKSGFVFPELAQMYQKNPDGVNRRLGRAFELAGFMDDEDYRALKEKNPETTFVRRGEVHEGREQGLCAANVRGFHSFRVTWITMALAAGVPMELVRRVTGHKAADIVLKNYFRPGREEFARTIEGAMPELLMGESVVRGQLGAGSAQVRDATVVYEVAATSAAMIRKAIEALEKLSARNWQAQGDEALRSLRGAAEWVEGQ